jgi:ABC-2 type transport system ATP-binding protein
MQAIQVSSLTKRYRAALAVDDISFSVATGQTVGLLGGNGAGKTTTIAMLLGLLVPTAGSIHMLGHDMAKDRFAALARLNFSSPYVALPARLTVAENLRVYAHLYNVPQMERRIRDLADELDLNGLLERRAGQLSAGQKTRVALAKSLINKPELLLLDEPTASLDPDTGDLVRSWLERYKAETGCTILLASHNMDEVARLCDTVLMMKQGSIVDRGTPDELLQRYGRDDLEDVFLDIARNRDRFAPGEARGEVWGEA